VHILNAKIFASTFVWKARVSEKNSWKLLHIEYSMLSRDRYAHTGSSEVADYMFSLRTYSIHDCLDRLISIKALRMHSMCRMLTKLSSDSLYFVLVT
jgi:hypothetical protein